MRSKKNKIFCFFCSFLPGAAEMYMGFMKMGTSLMALFFLCFIIPALLGASNVFILAGTLVWFFGFFHAGNLSSCSDEEFQNKEDVFIWEEFGQPDFVKIEKRTVNKWFAIILIICGVFIIWHNIRNILYQLLPDVYCTYALIVMDKIPEIVFAILIIFIGARMIAGKKEQMEEEEPEIEDTKIEQKEDTKLNHEEQEM